MSVPAAAALVQLARAVHARLYHDIGAEVDPTTFEVTTPYCGAGVRRLGDLTQALPVLEDTTAHNLDDDTVMRQAMIALDTERWVVTRHLGCFHRRSKAAYDLAFSVWAEVQQRVPEASCTLVHRAELDDGSVLAGPPDRPPRILRIDLGGGGQRALRSDGELISPGQAWNYRHAWRAGWSPAAIADLVIAGSRPGRAGT